MSSRTLSLLLLFVIGLALTGLALAATVAAGAVVAGPWLVPFTAVICFTATLFAGRRFILPAGMAARTGSALGRILLVVAGSMTAAFGLMWLVQRAVGQPVPGPIPGVVVWFVALWLAVTALHRGGSRHAPRLP